MEEESDGIAQIFVDTLEDNIKEIYRKFPALTNPKKQVPIKLTEKDKKDFIEATVCHICGNQLDENKVRDHCHLTGRYRGAAHNECNLSYTLPKFVPVFFHNLSGYDSHLFVKKLKSVIDRES